MKLTQPISDNLSSFQLSVVKNVCGIFLQEDLSTTVKDKTEPIIVLSKVREDSKSDQEALSKGDFVLKHFFASYVVLLPHHSKDLVRQELHGLALTIAEGQKGQLLIVSGTVDIWVGLIRKHSTRGSDALTLQIFNEIQVDLESKGFAFAFRGFNKEINGDTFYLEKK